ncbi:tetratricopeptide repeat protein, partial [bacterium]|nr:tetratricopeptide repeat protein [bacterium]
QGLGRWEEAVTHHKKAIAMNPGYLKFYNLGIAYGKMGNYKEAIEAFQSSIRWKPDYAESYYNLGVAYYKLMHWPDAIENLKLAVQKHPNHARAHLALGLAYLAKGERILARKQYEILRELDPELAKKMK